MSNTSNTITLEKNPQHSELHGGYLSLAVAASGILILLVIVILIVRLHKKQQREMNSTNHTISLADVNCQRVSEAAIELPALPILLQLSTDKADITDCAVCLAEIGASNSGRLLPTCGHAFHQECIASWFRYQTTCPVCRSNILRQPCANENVLHTTA